MAKITRDQFDESKKVAYKIIQHETPGMDADFNEQIQIARYDRMRILSAMVGYANKRFGDGFKVIQKGVNNTVTVKAGICAVHIADKLAIKLQTVQTDVAGWTTPSGGDRTDYLYLDIYFDEIDSEDDPNLINPARGQESAIDYRLFWSFEKSEGAVPGTPPAGHTYVSIAQIERQNGDPSIVDADITNLLEDHNAVLKDNEDDTFDGNLTVTGNIILSASKTVDGFDPSKYGAIVWAMNLEIDCLAANAGDVVAWDTGSPFSIPCWEVTTGYTNEIKLVKPHLKNPNAKYLRITTECREIGTGSVLRFYAGASYTDIDIPGVTGIETAYIDISSLTDWEYFDIKVELRNGSSSCHARKVVIYETYA